MEEVVDNIITEAVDESDTSNETTQIETVPFDESWEEAYAEEVQALQEIYPTVDMTSLMANEAFRSLLTGEVKPTLRQVYEMLNPTVLVETQVQTKVEEVLAQALEAAVAEAVERTEKNLLAHIQARGMRPPENGRNASLGVRTHPAVHRLTKHDRAKLALMAQQGETVHL